MALLEYVQGLPPTDFEAAAAGWLTANRGTWAPKTTQRRLGTVRAFAKFCGDPAFLADYRPPKPARPTPHPIPEGVPAVTRMLELCGHKPRRQALVALIGLCGLRVSEARSIKPTHLNDVERVLTVRGKGDKTRVVPIGDRAWAALASALAVTAPGDTLVGLSDRQARQAWSDLAHKATGRHHASHDGRATFATAGYEATKDIRAMQELLGHSSMDTTQVYVGASMAAMREAVNL